MHDMVRDLKLGPGQVFDRAQVASWFQQRYPLVKEGTIAAHLVRLSTNARTRVHYTPKSGEDDLFFQIDGSHFRLYEVGHDPLPITKQNPAQQAALGTEPESSDDLPEGRSEFAYERDLRSYLARNLHLIEAGLRLYEEEGVTGIEFPVGGRFVDILAVDRKGNYVVIELKVSRGYDRVVGQLLRYIAWIEQHHADPGQTVRGVIVAKEMTDDLCLACSRIDGVSLYEYELSVSLRPVASKVGKL
jgi:endonuclease